LDRPFPFIFRITGLEDLAFNLTFLFLGPSSFSSLFLFIGEEVVVIGSPKKEVRRP